MDRRQRSSRQPKRALFFPAFLVMFFLPPAISMVAIAYLRMGDHQAQDRYNFAVNLWFVSLFAMLICSIVSAILVSCKEGCLPGFLTFVVVLVFYVVVGFAGCGALTGSH